jgi:hypothetical protein
MNEAPARRSGAEPSRAWGDTAWLAAGFVAFVALFGYASLWASKGPAVAAIVALAALSLGAGLWRARTTPASIAVVLAGFGLYAVYADYTRPGERNTDPSAHVAYVTWLLEHHSLPPADHCVVCHHPPVYYLVAAAVHRLAEWTHLAEPTLALQGLAVVLFAVFLYFSVRSVDLLLPRPSWRVLATSLIVFWPSSVINSIRISNDLMLYAFVAAVFHAMVLWSMRGGRRLLVAACLATGAAILVKSNALVIVAMLCAIVARRFWRATDRKAVVRDAVLPAAALVTFSLGVELVRGNAGESLPAKVLGTAYNPIASQTTHRTIAYYLTFDPVAIVTTPYVEMRQFRSQEPTFWNHLIKSSLFGTRNPAFMQLVGYKEPNAELATAENYALLGLMAVLLVGAVVTWRDRSEQRTLCLVHVGAFTAGSVALHLLAPLGYHADFRLVFPVVVPMSVLFARVVDGMRRRGLAVWHAGYIASNVFVVLSIAYFMPFTFPAKPAGAAHGLRPRPVMPFRPQRALPPVPSPTP